jgi:hypothetical protein
MARPMFVLLLAAAALPLAAERAGADCAMPQVTAAPLGGATLPADPTVHLFVPYGDASAARHVRVTGQGEPLAFEAAVVSQTRAYTVVRVAVESAGHERVTIGFGDRGAPTFSYTIDRRWQAPADAPRVTAARREHSAWTCSYTDAWLLEIAPAAPAYRVEWAPSPQAWARGARALVVVPHHHADFFRWGDQPASAPSVIGLGHLSCLGETVTPAAPGVRPIVRITALDANGAERTGRVTELAEDGPPDPEAVGGAFAPDPRPHVPTVMPPVQVAAAAAPPAASAHRWWALGAGVALLALLFAARLTFWRRRAVATS